MTTFREIMEVANFEGESKLNILTINKIGAAKMSALNAEKSEIFNLQ